MVEITNGAFDSYVLSLYTLYSKSLALYLLLLRLSDHF